MQIPSLIAHMNFWYLLCFIFLLLSNLVMSIHLNLSSSTVTDLLVPHILFSILIMHMCLCMYICICVCMYVLMYICMYACGCMYVHIYLYVCRAKENIRSLEVIIGSYKPPCWYGQSYSKAWQEQLMFVFII